MMRGWKKGGVFLAAPVLAMLVASFASCATNVDASAADDDRGVIVPPPSEQADADADATIDAGVDAGCDPSDPDCTTEVVRCDSVDFCLVDTPLSPLHSLAAVWGSSKSDVWAVGSGGTILHYDGTSWTQTPTGVQNTFFAIWGSGPNDIWVVSSTDVVMHSTGFESGTATWVNHPTGVSPYSASFVRAVWGSSPDDVWIGGRTVDAPGLSGVNRFAKTALPDGGIGWRPILGKDTVMSMWGSSADDVWMTADNVTYVSHERGKTMHGVPVDAGQDASAGYDTFAWTAIDSQSLVPLEAIRGTSANDVWAVGSNGTIRRITAPFERWETVDSGTKQTLRAVWGSGPNDVWVVGDTGTVLHFDGTAFQPASVQLPLGRKPKLSGVWGSGPDDVWIVGDGVVLHYTGPKSGEQAGAQ